MLSLGEISVDIHIPLNLAETDTSYENQSYKNPRLYSR